MNFVLNVVVKATVILFSAALLSLILRRASASTRHAVWLLALLSAVILPAAAIIVPALEWPVLPQAATSVTFVLPQPVEHTLNPATTFSPATSMWHAAESWITSSFVWLIGVGFVVARLLLGTLALRRIAKAAVPRESPEWNDLVTELSTSLSLRKRTSLLFSDSRISPMTWGLFRHSILLPASAATWPAERRRVVLAHELAHVKRHDGVIQILVQLICGVYWFNPLAWYAAHRIRIERERVCDDHVLSLGTAATDYADHLIQMVRGLRGGRSLSFASISMAQPSQLETRLVSILDSRVRRRGISRPAAASMCAIAGLLTVSMAGVGITGAVQPPPVITRLIPAPAALAAPATPPAPAVKPQKTRIGDVGALPNNTLVPPQVASSKPPIYTDEALRANIEGIVTLEVDVDNEGNFRILRVVKGLGYGLDERAMGSVLDWKFAPALRNGVPVRAITQVDVDFKLPPPPQIAGVPIFRIGSGVLPPTVITRVEPKYPAEARAAHYQGTVVLEVTIKKDGTVDVVKVVRELGLGLDEAAVEAIKQWRFRPGTRNGQPVDVGLNVEVNFHLK